MLLFVATAKRTGKRHFALRSSEPAPQPIVAQSTSTDDDINFTSFVNAVDLPYSVSDMTAVSVPESFFTTNDGPRIYLMGGCISDQTCIIDPDPAVGIYCQCTAITNRVMYYTPQTNQYHTSVAPMPVERFRHVAAREGNYIYIAGGRNISDTVIPEVYRYDVVADSWEFVTNWVNATSDGVAFTTPSDSNLYLVSGYSQTYEISGAMDVLDTTTGQFLPANSYPPMQVPRGDTQIASLYDTQYYVIGGWSYVNDDSFCFPMKTTEYYDVLQREWFTASTMTYGGGDLATGVLDNMIFAVGGEQKEQGDATCTYSVPVKDVERYTNSMWVTEESIPDNIFRFVGATYNTSNSLYSSAIYLFGGQGMYNAETNLFPVRNSTLVYYPQAIYGNQHRKKLDAAGIAGIVVAGVVVLACIVLGIVTGLVYRYTYYRYKPLDEADPVSPTTAGREISMAQIKVKDDRDLEVIEMQENFPDHVVQSRAISHTTDRQVKF